MAEHDPLAVDPTTRLTRHQERQVTERETLRNRSSTSSVSSRPGQRTALNLAGISTAPDELQIGFSDVGTPNDEEQATYGRLKEKLVERGMPAARIRFIHEAKNGNDKAALFAECRRDGGTLVILGSTDKLGTGTNIQHRCIAIHDIDAPYRPSDLEQRLGRGQRPGNRNKVVLNFRYVTARTFDAYIWQMLTRKAGFITQILTGKLDRTVEDVTADQVISYAHIQAAATDQPLLLEKATIEQQVKALTNARRSHQLGVSRLQRQIESLPRSIRAHRERQKMYQALAAAYTGEFGDDDAERLEALVKEPWRGRQVFAGLTVSIGSWYTNKGESSPLLRVHGGDTAVEVQLRKFHNGRRFLEEVRSVGEEAPWNVDSRMSMIRRDEEDLASAKASVGRKFEQEDELTGALARLDQIDAELHREAAQTARDEVLSAEDRAKFEAEQAKKSPAAVAAEVAEFALELGDDASVRELFDRPVVLPDTSGDDLDMDGVMPDEFAEMVLHLEADDDFLAMFE